ncbi:hypothetical protein GCM10027570_46120 [Streptomonospora sediminis]
MEQRTAPSRWDCRLCARRGNDSWRDICGYCGNPESANRTLPALPPKPSGGGSCAAAGRPDPASEP